MSFMTEGSKEYKKAVMTNVRYFSRRTRFFR
jgi:hypothetical protein